MWQDYHRNSQCAAAPPFGRFFRFGLVGIATATLYVVAGTTIWTLTDTSKVSSSTMAFMIAITFNYFAHKLWTFQSRIVNRVTAPKYATVIAGGMLINAMVVRIGSQQLEWHYVTVQIIAVAIIIVWNFTLFNAWVFRH